MFVISVELTDFDLNLDKTTGESMANAVLSSLTENSIDVAFVRGQAYDSAAAVS